MTDHITPELLVALDMAHSDMWAKRTIDYLETHKAPDLDAEIAKVRESLAAAEAEEANTRARRKSWVYYRKITFRKTRGNAVKERALVYKYCREGATKEELVKITGWTIKAVKAKLGEIFDDD